MILARKREKKEMKLKDLPQDCEFREISESLPLKWHKSKLETKNRVLCLCDEEVNLHGDMVIIHHSVWLNKEVEIVALRKKETKND